LFQLLDADRDSQVSKKEFIAGVKSNPGCAELLILSPSDLRKPCAEVDALLREVFNADLDCTNSGYVDLDEMLRGLRRRRFANIHREGGNPDNPERDADEIPFEVAAPRTITSAFGSTIQIAGFTNC